MEDTLNFNEENPAQRSLQGEPSDLLLVHSPEMDLVAERYKILVTRPLIEYDTVNCNAYEVENIKNPADTVKYYALVFKPGIPVPFKKFSLFRKHIFDNIQIPIESEFVKISLNSQITVVSIFSKIELPSLESLIIDRIPLSNNTIIQNILLPIARLMYKFETLNIVHGRLTIKNIFFHPVSNQLLVGECVSEYPCYSYPHYYKPIDIMETIPQTVGDSNLAHDFFAIGVSIGLLISSKTTFDNQTDLIAARYESNSFEVLFGKYITLSLFKDLMRGLLNDHAPDRWRTKQIIEWFNGKRYSTNSSNLKEPTRTLLFNDRKFTNIPSFSHYLFMNWDLGKKAFQDDNVLKWIEKGLAMPETAESINYLLKYGYRPQISPYPERDEITVKILATLHPMAPLRLRDMAISIDSLPNLIAFGFAQNKPELIDAAGRAICLNLWNGVMVNQLRSRDTFFLYKYITPLDNAKSYLEKKQIGFGMERCLYELNPTLPCQSPIVIKDFPLTVTDLLTSLESKAAEDSNINLLDNHLLSFITAKLGLSKETRFSAIEYFAKVSSNTIVKAAIIYASAQSLPPYKSYNNLTNIFAEKLNEVLEEALSSKTIKENIKTKLTEAKESGNISNLVRIVTDPQYLKKDYSELQKAITLAKLLKTQLKALQNQSKIYDIGYRYGFKLCVSLSYLLFSFMLIYTIYQSI